MNLKPNTTLQNGKYRIIRVLGQGGFGITYLAEHTLLKNKVAIKEFFPKTYCYREDNSDNIRLRTSSEEKLVDILRKKFFKEAQNIKKLTHDGIIKIHDIFEENETAYYVMDYIEGESLQSKVKYFGKLRESIAKDYIIQIGEALSYIHSRNMTHFDIKPANIVIRQSDNKPILIDFGLSVQYDENGDETSTHLAATSMGYSAPETYTPEKLSSFSPKSDVYSLAMTFYFMLTGKVPPSPFELINKELDFPNNTTYRLRDAIKVSIGTFETRTASVKDFLSLLDKKSTSVETKTTYASRVNNSEKTLLVKNIATSGNELNDKQNNNQYAQTNKYKRKPLLIFFIILSIVLVVFLIILVSKNFDSTAEKESRDMANSDNLSNNVEYVEENALNLNAEENITQQYGVRNYTISGNRLSLKYDLKVDNGILYVKLNGSSKADEFRCNKNVSAEKILDQFEALSYYWAASELVTSLVDNGLFYENIADSMLKYLKKSYELFSPNNGNDNRAYNAAKDYYKEVMNFKNKWKYETSYDPAMEDNMDDLRYILSEHPIQAKDIYYNF